MGQSADFLSLSRTLLAPQPAQPLAAESVEIYSSDCTTPKATFLVGETVCAKPTGVTASNRFLNWISPGGTVAYGGSGVTSIDPNNPQTFLYAPMVAGAWKASIADPSDSSITPGYFDVVAPPTPVVTYAANCTTPKTTFSLGEEVCVKVVGINPLFNRRIAWVDPGGYIREDSNGNLFTNVASDPQEAHFTLPSTDTSTISDVYTVDNRGSWRVAVVSSRNSVLAVAPLTVEGATPVADLSVTAGLLNGSVNPGDTITYVVTLTNRGPNDASNVELTDPTPINTTYQSVTQTAGPAFDCSGSDSTSVKCTSATFANGAAALFEIKYAVGAAGSSISNSASVTSDTADNNTADNGSNASQVRVGSSGTPSACSLECPNDLTVTANTTQGGQSGAVVTFSATGGNGTCGTISTTPSSGSFFTVGSHIVQSSSSQGGGSCSFTVTVIDTPPPTISCPADVEVTADDGDCSKAVDPGTPTSSAGSSVSGVRSDGAELTDPYPSGDTTITWTATDSNNRKASCSQKITVHSNDTVKPTITAPADITLYTGAGSDVCGAVVSEESRLTATASDNCSVNVTRTGVPAGNFFPVGTTTVTYTAKDGANNTATAEQHVTVIDNTAPIIFAPPDANYVCPSDVPAASASQATGPDVIVIVNEQPQSHPGPPADNCGTPLVTVTEASVGAGSASSPKVITRTFTAKDASGNESSDSQTITVIDSIAPTIQLNGDATMTVECHTVFNDPGATGSDNCGNATVTTAGSVNANAVGSYTLTYTAHDAAGNASAPVSRTVNVVDTIAPVITLNGANPMTVECHTGFTDPGATANDGCAGDLTSSIVATGSVNANVVGSYTRTYTVSDGNGHTTTATRTVNVVDTTPPTITLKNVAISLWPPNHKYQTVNVSDLVLSASDGCDTTISLSKVVISKVTSDETENGNGDGNTLNDIVIGANCKSVQLRAERNGGGNGRVYTITFKVKDAEGNVGTASAKVTVPENQGGTAIDNGPVYTVNGSCP